MTASSTFLTLPSKSNDHTQIDLIIKHLIDNKDKINNADEIITLLQALHEKPAIDLSVLETIIEKLHGYVDKSGYYDYQIEKTEDIYGRELLDLEHNGRRRLSPLYFALKQLIDFAIAIKTQVLNNNIKTINDVFLLKDEMKEIEHNNNPTPSDQDNKQTNVTSPAPAVVINKTINQYVSGIYLNYLLTSQKKIDAPLLKLLYRIHSLYPIPLPIGQRNFYLNPDNTKLLNRAISYREVASQQEWQVEHQKKLNNGNNIKISRNYGFQYDYQTNECTWLRPPEPGNTNCWNFIPEYTNEYRNTLSSDMTTSHTIIAYDPNPQRERTIMLHVLPAQATEAWAFYSLMIEAYIHFQKKYPSPAYGFDKNDSVHLVVFHRSKEHPGCFSKDLLKQRFPGVIASLLIYPVDYKSECLVRFDPIKNSATVIADRDRVIEYPTLLPRKTSSAANAKDTSQLVQTADSKQETSRKTVMNCSSTQFAGSASSKEIKQQADIKHSEACEYYIKKAYVKAKQLYEETLKILEASPKLKKAQASTWIAIANCCKQLQDRKQERECLDKALTLYKTCSDIQEAMLDKLTKQIKATFEHR